MPTRWRCIDADMQHPPLYFCCPVPPGPRILAPQSVAASRNIVKVLHPDATACAQTNNFKVVYVAPMKALAAEVTHAFSKRLQPLGGVFRSAGS